VAQTPPAPKTPPASNTPGPGAQAPGAQNTPIPAPDRRQSSFNAGQKRPPGDPVQIARGKTLYGINCRACHGVDLRGGDMGGPNLLRSQVALSDQNGELIVPIIQGSRKNQGMPAIGISPDDAKAVAAYVRDVMGTIQSQGAPPSEGKPAPSILVGNANEGKAYFAAKCSGCHSTADMSQFIRRVTDEKKLQTAWVAGGVRGEEGATTDARTVTATITTDSGETVTGKLVRIDDFVVDIQLADGSQQSFRRNGDSPKVVLQDPMKAHRDMLSQYTDSAIHDVTAYLVTLK
jgi:cytochrome c oxidase cbb3-type subunit 3